MCSVRNCRSFNEANVSTQFKPKYLGRREEAKKIEKRWKKPKKIWSSTPSAENQNHLAKHSKAFVVCFFAESILSRFPRAVFRIKISLLEKKSFSYRLRTSPPKTYNSLSLSLFVGVRGLLSNERARSSLLSTLTRARTFK
jgi:hypothetical protein